MKNKISRTLLFSLFCTAQIAVNTLCMDPTSSFTKVSDDRSLYELRRTGVEQIAMDIEHEIPKLLPEIQGKIVTTIFDLYLNELEDVLTYYETHKSAHDEKWENRTYEPCAKELFNKILFWIDCTRFNPVQSNINFDTISKNGATLLHHTTWATFEYTEDRTKGHYNRQDYNSKMYALTLYLLKHNANPNIQNRLGQTAFLLCLFLLKNKGQWSCKKILEETLLEHFFTIAKADPNIPSRNDNAFCILASKNYYPITKQIIEQVRIKEFINSKNFYGSPAQGAAMNFNIEFLRILKDAGADFNIKDCLGKTPLVYASSYAEIPGCKKLHGAECVDATIELLQSVTNTGNQ